MLHEPAAPSGKDYATAYKVRVGAWVFLLYALFYGGFVVLNVLKPVMMETPVLFGMSLAVVYGFGLIVLALVLALIYNAMCGKEESRLRKADEEGRDA